MQLKLNDIAAMLGATAHGDPETPVTGVAGIEDAGPGDLTFCIHPKYAPLLASTPAAVVLVPLDFQGESSAALIRVEDPYRALVQVVREVKSADPGVGPGVHETAVVDPTARLGTGVRVGVRSVIGEGVEIGEHSVIGAGVVVERGVKIGTHARLHANVSLLERVVLGDRVEVHAGAVIGSDGFGYLTRDGRHEKIPQVGTVVIEDDVEIGANAAVDRATLGVTRIGAGVKIDNLVHIGHNVTVGAASLIIAQVGIAGSTQVGKGATLAGQAGVAPHVKIGDGAVVGAKSGVTKSVSAGARVSGYPAMEHDRAKRLLALYRRLPHLFARLKGIEERVRELEVDRENVL